MSILNAVLQGVLQGLTEFLPISSSGHLVLFQHFTGQSSEGSLFFGLMLHLGTLAAVVVAYYKEIWDLLKELGQMAKELVRGQFRLKTQNPTRHLLYMLFVATLPLVLVLPLRGLVSSVTGDSDIIVEGVCFLITSLLLFGAVKAKPGKAGAERMRVSHALTVGFLQGVAVMPGISRSGATLSTGLVLGFQREFMVRFAFLLSIPAILGGAVAELFDLDSAGLQVGVLPLLLGMLSAAVVGYLCIRLVRWLVSSNRLVIFAWYTLILGAVVVLLGIIELFTGPLGAAAEVAEAVSSAAQSLPAESVPAA